MCGIVGYLNKTDSNGAALGHTVLDMLDPIARRGPDSAGVALYGSPRNGGLVLRIKLGEKGTFGDRAGHVIESVETLGSVCGSSTASNYLRLEVDYGGDPQPLEDAVESVDREIEVVSMGRRLEIVKQVGSPRNLQEAYGISTFVGTHGIGHTRLSTESKIDLSHSQPFWAHGCLDLAAVHNGHITNYHKLRRIYEQRGVRFYTHNDSEVIGVYLAERLSQGMTLEEALGASVADLDGSFCYIAATPDAVGFAKDPFALKPLLFTETEHFVAIATEEIAIHTAFGGTYEAREAQAGEVRVWQTS